MWRQKSKQPQKSKHPRDRDGGGLSAKLGGWYLDFGSAPDLLALLERGGYGVHQTPPFFEGIQTTELFLREVWWCTCDCAEDATALTLSWKLAIDEFINDDGAIVRCSPDLRYLGPDLDELIEDKLMSAIESSAGMGSVLKTSTLTVLEQRYRPVTFDHG